MRSYNSDHRTPLAWRHRDTTLHTSPTRGQMNQSMHHHHRRPPTPSETTTTSGDEREEVPMVRHGTPFHHHHHHHNHHHHNHQRRPGSRSRNSSSQQHPRDEHSQFSGAEGTFRNGNGGTLRSTRSVPALALATWDGEPCPVHGHGIPFYHQPPPPMPYAPGSLRRHGSLFDMRSPFYPGLMPPPPPHPALLMGPPPPQLLDKKSFHGSMQMLAGPGHFPPHFMPPMMRPRPFVFPAGVEPLPVRDPFKNGRTPPPSGYAGSKSDDPYSVDQVCCKGHLIVLWIILAVVTIGVILGIVLGVTIA